MTTHAELLALRDASRAAKAERDIAAGLAADAAGRLAAAEDALASAEQELGQARLELDTLAGLSDERDALLSAASQADVTAAADETAADGLAARIAEIERELRLLPPGSPQARRLLTELAAGRRRRADRLTRAGAARAAAANNREKASAVTSELEARLPAAETAHSLAVSAHATAMAELEPVRAADAAARARLQTAQAADAAARQVLDTALEALMGGLDPAVPLLLLPVRLETRFGPLRADGARVLRIRVYPDDVHQDTHQPGVTATEQTSGQSFWTDLWRAGRDEAGVQRRQAAWQRLVQRHGPGRGRYIADTLRPTNTADRPTDPVPDGDPTPTPPCFPTPPVVPATWTRAPHTTVLPDRWLAIGYADGNRVFAQWGEIIPRPLPTGPSPSDDLMDPADVGPGMRWMVDFAVAAQVGMGITVRLGPGDPQRLDRLVVLGVQGTASAAEGATSIRELLDAHAFSWGLDLVPQGTPTNNDERRPAGFAAHSAAPNEVARIDAAPADPGDGSDAAELAAGLGFADPDAALWRAPHAAWTDQRDAQAMATALWPATWGYYLRQMLAPALDGQSLDQWRRFTLDTVRGRGPLPAIRTGNQPYGILPTTSLRRWRPERTGPALVLYHLETGGHAHQRVLWNLDPNGGWVAATDHTGVAPAFEPQAADTIDLALHDVDGDGRHELVLLDPGDDRAPPSYWLGPAIAEGGALDGDWHGPFETPFGSAPGDGSSLAVSPDGTLVIAQLLTRRGRTQLAIARGTGLGPGGVERWLPTSIVDLGLHPAGRLVGLAAADQLVALFATVTNGHVELSYRSGTIPRRGALQWSEPVALPHALSPPLGAAGVALHDLDGDAVAELLVHAATPSGAGFVWQFWIGTRSDDGAFDTWTGPFDAATMPDLPTGGAAVAGIGRTPGVTLASPAGLVNLLIAARDLWLDAAASGKVPFVGRGDPDRDILDILASDALSSSVAARRLVGREFQDALWTFAGAPLPTETWNQVVSRCGTQLQSLGLDLATRLDNAAYVEEPVEWRDPWIQKGGLAETGVLTEDYLGWAATASPEDLHDFAGIIDREPLLLHLVRHSTLQAYADVAMREVPPPEGPWREPELVDIGRFEHGDHTLEDNTLTSWRYIHLPQQGRHLGDEARALSDADDPRAADLSELRRALEWLAGRPPAALERLLAESLDLASHRLDAWLTAIATVRLRSLRAHRATGLHIGGYGLVEDLEPAGGAPSTGFVHAPSLAHATTAAVLRSGYLTHRADPGAEAFAVDLSSRRVRAALELADGIRTGQPLGSLLGYRFERALHEHPTLPLARYVAGFREIAPIAAGKLIDIPDNTPVEAVAARNVVDGLALLRLSQTGGIEWGKTPTGQPVALPMAGSAEQTALLAILHDLDAGLDALSDLSIAESLHHVAQGNPTASGATVDALSRGELPPVDHDVARAARSGVGVSHRVLVVLESPEEDDAALALWAPHDGTGFGVRGDAEPRLNAWAARLLGDPAAVTWSASYPAPGDGAPGPIATFTLADIGLSPLDVLAIPGAAPGGDLERRLVLHAARHAPGGAVDRLPLIDLAPAGAEVPLPRLLEVAAAARDLLASARALEPADLLPPGETGDAAGLAELGDRLTAAASRVEAALDELRGHFELADPPTARTVIAAALGIPAAELGAVKNLLDLPASTDVARAGIAVALPGSADEVRDALLAVANCGVAGAVPQTPFGVSPADLATLTDQASAAAREARRRVTAARTASDPHVGFEELLGRDFCALPVFAPSNRASLSAALTERHSAGDAGPEITSPWLQQLAEVREGVGRLERALLFSEAVTASVHGGVEIAQLPSSGDPPERWVALPPLLDGPMRSGRMSLALHAPFGLTLADGAMIAGLAIDDWVEVVPAGQETTALAFHYDGPGSCAPQALLLAVPPVPGRRWDVETLEDVIAETVDLVSARSVDPDAMPALGQFLPALMLACNLGGDPHGDTVSTQAPIT